MPTFYGASELQAMLDEFGVAVTVGATTAKGIRDEADETMLGGAFAAMRGRKTTVLVKTGTFSLTRGAAITVDGTAYKIHDFAEEDDGAVTRVYCATSV